MSVTSPALDRRPVRPLRGGFAVRNTLDYPYACYLFAGSFFLAIALTATFTERGGITGTTNAWLGLTAIGVSLAVSAGIVVGWRGIVANRIAIAIVVGIAIAAAVLPSLFADERMLVKSALPGMSILALPIAFGCAMSLVFALGSSLALWHVPPLAVLGVWCAGAIVAWVTAFLPFTKETAVVVAALPTVVAASWFLWFRGRYPGRRFAWREPSYASRQALGVTLVVAGIALGALWTAIWLGLDEKPGRWALGEFVMSLLVPAAIVAFGIERYPNRRRAAERDDGITPSRS